MTNHHQIQERKTRFVVILTAFTMVVEIMFGYWTNSMALLADGWHMASHVLALGISWIAYIIVRKYSQRDTFSFQTDKFLSLAGFTSAIALQFVAILMAVQSVDRLLHPIQVRFAEALVVAIIGLIVNAVSAVMLHHSHEHGDHNIRSAYLHVLADGLTSLFAIMAITAGMYFNILWLDSVGGIISAVVITKWAVELIRSSGKVLIEFKTK